MVVFDDDQYYVYVDIFGSIICWLNKGINFPEIFTKESHWKSISKRKKFKNLRKKGAKIPEKSDVLYFLSYLPPFSNFVLLSLTPLPPGHHLCTFPNAIRWPLEHKKMCVKVGRFITNSISFIAFWARVCLLCHYWPHANTNLHLYSFK